ncbi:hypothetical protein F4778DRAFT_348976 [Xylariomycetidae sp. FL2044]|nr:hypothetical protein F4778DRAFT_348976 [Xylariomycetidae sp. FL2044]
MPPTSYFVRSHNTQPFQASYIPSRYIHHQSVPSLPKLSYLTELGRLAQTAALRSTSILRTSCARWQPVRHLSVSVPCLPGSRHLATTSALSSTKAYSSKEPPVARFITAPAQRQSYSSSSWSNPNRQPRSAQDNNVVVKKPRSADYDRLPRFSRTSSVPPLNDINDNDSRLHDFIDEQMEKIYFKKGEIDRDPRTEANDSDIPPKPNLRLVPRTGRTIHVRGNVDVARSFTLLGVQVAQNKLRSDFQYQRYHERPGLKRKRLSSERWQRRFKKGFKACVSRVSELRRQGW